MNARCFRFRRDLTQSKSVASTKKEKLSLTEHVFENQGGATDRVRRAAQGRAVPTRPCWLTLGTVQSWTDSTMRTRLS